MLFAGINAPAQGDIQKEKASFNLFYCNCLCFLSAIDLDSKLNGVPGWGDTPQRIEINNIANEELCRGEPLFC